MKHKTVKCKGSRRHGGAFSIGPPQWVDCTELAVVMLRIKQDGNDKTFPSCMKCWEEGEAATGIEILMALPIVNQQQQAGLPDLSEN